MKLFLKQPALRQEYLQQRSTIFGKKRYLFHIVMWIAALCYLSFVIFSDGFENGVKAGSGSSVNGVSVKETPFIMVSVMSSVVGAIMVYFYLLFAIPFARFKKQRRYLWIGFIINCTVWVVAFTATALILGLTHQQSKKLSDDDATLVFMLSAVFSGIMAGFFFSLYYFLDLYDQQKYLNRYKLVLTQKLEAETHFLKMQINPHFLFNTLNNIYSLTLSRSSDAAHITRQLKDLITYMLKDCTQDQVPLSGEIDFLKNYINLEELRNKQDNIDIQLRITGDIDKKYIAPLLLINFIENAFKHGVKAGIDNAYVKINLVITGNILTLEIVNSKPENTIQQKAVQEAGGIGIENVKRRLNILYPNKHKLRINETAKEYSVYLSIDL